ncbi:putative tRNA threonylcarbamoyladenosine biosynthesis protein kae1 [Entophlyctis luteolus]|nr:putative tRNA threonylcarbamoyladenosine biosynthesis protein kae1 [Entophlyctis luteolus]
METAPANKRTNGTGKRLRAASSAATASTATATAAVTGASLQSNASAPAASSSTSPPVTSAIPNMNGTIASQSSSASIAQTPAIQNNNANVAAIAANPLFAQLIAQNMNSQFGIDGSVNPGSTMDNSQLLQQQLLQQHLMQQQQQILLRVALANAQNGQAQVNPNYMQALLLNQMANMAQNNQLAGSSGQGASQIFANSQLPANSANLAALLASNPNNARVLQFLAAKQALMNGAVGAGANGTGLANNASMNGTPTANASTTANASAGATGSGLNPVLAAMMSNLNRGMSPSMLAMLQQNQNISNTSSSVIPNQSTDTSMASNNAPPMAAAISAPSPAPTLLDPAPQQQVTPQVQPQQTPQIPPPQQFIENRNILAGRLRQLQEAINRPGATEIERLTLLLNRLAIQVQIAQIDHVYKVNSGVQISEAEATTTKNTVQALKTQMNQAKSRLILLQQQEHLKNAASGITDNATPTVKASTSENSFVNLNQPATQPSAQSPVPNRTPPTASNSTAPQAQIFQKQQPSAILSAGITGSRPSLMHNPSPQQSRKLFGGYDSFLGGHTSGPFSTPQGFLLNRALKTSERNMEQTLRDYLDDNMLSRGIDLDGSRGAKRKMKDLMAEMERTSDLEQSVQDFLYDIADNFLDEVTHMACRVAKHRNSTTVDVKDFQFPLERNWNLRIPNTTLHTQHTSAIPVAAATATGSAPSQQTAAGSGATALPEIQLLTSRSTKARGPSSNHVARVIQVRRAMREELAAAVRQRAAEEAAARAAAEASWTPEKDSDDAEGEEDGGGSSGLERDGTQDDVGHGPILRGNAENACAEAFMLEDVKDAATVVPNLSQVGQA